MATDSKNVALVPLNGKNYSTWKVQCRMALMRDGLWDRGGFRGGPRRPRPPLSVRQRFFFCQNIQ